eukprot:scaffold207855_cov26-Tisochrysis_lutea.AAC.1
MTTTLQDSFAEGPPSKRKRSTIKHTSMSLSRPLSQNDTGANASQSTANSPTPYTQQIPARQARSSALLLVPTVTTR